MSSDLHPELDDLLGAYALDAVDGDERRRVEAYLDDSPVARREVDELRETAAMLALAPIDHEAAPADLWSRIEQVIAPSAATDASDGGVTAGAAGPVISLDDARRRRALSWRVLAPVAAVAAAFVAVLVVVQTGDEAPADRLAAHFDDMAETGEMIELTGSATAPMALADGHGMIKAQDLPALDEGEVYQAWAVYPGLEAPVSVGVFGNDVEFTEFEYGDDLTAVAITVESEPGVVVSEQEPVAAAALS